MARAKDFALCGFDTIIDLEPMVAAAAAFAKRHGADDMMRYHPKGFTETIDSISSQIGRLRWCTETCFAHQTWARFDFQTTNLDVLARRIALTQEKLARIAARYTKET